MTNEHLPSGEDRVTAAFDDLKARVAAGVTADDNPAEASHHGLGGDPLVAPRTLPLNGRRRSLAVGLAAAATVVVLGTAGLWALFGADDGQGVATGPDTSATAPPNGDTVTTSTTLDPSVTPSSGPDAGDDQAPAAGQRFRVDSAAVAADRSDPFLNVRQGAGAGQPLMAKLPPSYRGLRATGAASRTDDGATWVEIELLAPVSLAPGVVVPDQGGPTGWVNRAFLVPLTEGIAVGLDEVPACGPDSTTEPAPDAADPTESHVATVESRLLTPTCLRVVVSFDPGQPPFQWEDVPSSAGTGTGNLPLISHVRDGSSGVTVNLGVTSAWWPAVNSTEPGVHLVRAGDGTLDLVAPAPATSASITVLPDEARAVIDLILSGEPAPPGGAGIVVIEQFPVSDSFDVAGIARPFEATLGVVVHDEQDQPVEAVFSGSDFLGTVRADAYGVSTNDWLDAWGRFAVRVTGLPRGNYTLVLSGDGGSDNPEVLSIPFTITMTAPAITLPPADDQAAALGLVALARGGPIEGVPLADTVTVGLALAEQRNTPRADLADRAAWVFDVDVFAGYAGPIDVLAPLTGTGHQITAGPANHCASPPLEWPEEWDGLRHLVVQPIGIDSCLQWYAVNLFLDDDGQIRVVMLELWEP